MTQHPGEPQPGRRFSDDEQWNRHKEAGVRREILQQRRLARPDRQPLQLGEHGQGNPGHEHCKQCPAQDRLVRTRRQAQGVQEGLEGTGAERICGTGISHGYFFSSGLCAFGYSRAKMMRSWLDGPLSGCTTL